MNLIFNFHRLLRIFVLVGLITLSKAVWSWSLSVSPDITLPESSVTVSAVKFPPRTLIDISFDHTNVCKNRSNASGELSCSFKIPSTTTPGLHFISAFIHGTETGRSIKVVVANANEVIGIFAHIDGLDRLILKEDTMQWDHIDKAAVGRHVGSNTPTFVMNWDFSLGVIGSGDSLWFPEWSAPPPDEIRQPELSSILTGVPMLILTKWHVEKITGRGDVTIVEQPSPANDNKLIVQFDDVVQGGSAPYTIRLIPVRSGRFFCGPPKHPSC